MEFPRLVHIKIRNSSERKEGSGGREGREGEREEGGGRAIFTVKTNTGKIAIDPSMMYQKIHIPF